MHVLTFEGRDKLERSGKDTYCRDCGNEVGVGQQYVLALNGEPDGVDLVCGECWETRLERSFKHACQVLELQRKQLQDVRDERARHLSGGGI